MGQQTNVCARLKSRPRRIASMLAFILQSIGVCTVCGYGLWLLAFAWLIFRGSRCAPPLDSNTATLHRAAFWLAHGFLYYVRAIPASAKQRIQHFVIEMMRTAGPLQTKTNAAARNGNSEKKPGAPITRAGRLQPPSI